MERPLTAGFACAVCGATVDVAAVQSWRCPNATPADRRHALQIVHADVSLHARPEPNPFVAFRPFLAWDSFVGAHGMSVAARDALIERLDGDVRAVDGVGFRVTPFARSPLLSDRLGFDALGGVWVKDETDQVAGSHKARHLFTILLHLVAAETLGLVPWRSAVQRPRLAIASCGNAALAAATLAAAARWPITVFVPPSADLHVTDRLGGLGATVVACPRHADDPPGDPCVHRFREAVTAGAVPFGVQGTENVWCLDGGRTIGWEMATQWVGGDESRPDLDRLFVQVGGGALAAGAADGLRMGGLVPGLHVVQTESSAPLVRAWEIAGRERLLDPGRYWRSLMWPWEHVGVSAADGILDDETYDWIPVMRALALSDGSAITVSEADVLQANDLAREATGVDVSVTGSAGLAGLMRIRAEVRADERIALVFSGVGR